MNKNGPPLQFQDSLISTQSGIRSQDDKDLLERAEKINSALFSISDAVNTTLNLNHLYQSIHQSLASIIDVTNFFIAIVDSKKRTLYFPYHVDTDDDDFGPITDFDNDASLTGLVVRQRKPVLLKKTDLDLRKSHDGIWGPAPLIWMGVPLIVKDTVIGVMAAQSYKDPHLYTDRDLQVLSAVSHQTAIAIDRKRSYDELEKSERRYRQLFDQSNDAIIIHCDGHITDVNQRACEMLGRSAKQLTRMDIADLEGKSDVDAIRNRYASVMSGQSMCWESKWKNAEGKHIPVEISVKLADHRKGIIQSIGRDITGRKYLEAQLMQSQKMESIGTLAGGIAHDFNNLLMGIQGRTSLILNDIKSSSHPHFEHLKSIEDYIKSATDLTKQILGFARIGKYEVKPTDLNALVTKSAELFGRTKKELIIHWKNRENTWAVDVDQSQIEQVLLNLYVNAWQAMPNGGELYLQTENIRLDRDYVKPFSIEPGKYVKISVTDTGVGMDKTTQERIFDPFFTTKEIGRGTGLGLASAYGIIKNHNGIINVYSKEGEGTTFNIYLPASAKEMITELESDQDTIKGEKTVLLIDDENMILDVGKMMLERLGYRVYTASNGKEALEIFKNRKKEIDLVILDMIMPDMGGGETFDQLKTIDSDVKVLLSSGYSIDGQASDILKRGCQGFIQKPFSMAEVSKKVHKIFV
jgi:two-component system, cell cycle sensor histidine kinase and response regulator CckA